MRDTLKNYIRAGFAGIYLQTHEEVRAEAEIKVVADELDYRLHSWSVTRGILDITAGTVRAVTDPVDVIDQLPDLPENSILLLNDYHQFLGDGQPASPLVTRALKERIREARCTGKVVIIQACRLCLPPELEKEFTIIEYKLPDVDVLAVIAKSITEAAGVDADPEAIERAAEAARGLTTAEAENIFALTVIRHRWLDPGFIASEKARTIGKTGLLELHENPVSLADVGGLNELKDWLMRRRNAFAAEAREARLLPPQGILIVGVPGTGKSLSAKATAAVFQQPLLKLDAGRIFGGIVGESEANIRQVIQTAEAIAPSVLWIDEIEKAFSGSQSSGRTDGGTSSRVFGSFLNWMQEKTAPVFVVATANDVTALPPEMLRKGRFDELFFVDLPTADERKSIWTIQLAAFGHNPEAFDIDRLTVSTEGYTGSEIKQIVIEAMYNAFDKQEDMTEVRLLEAAADVVPLSRLAADQVAELRQWAQGRTRCASVKTESSETRHLR